MQADPPGVDHGSPLPPAGGGASGRIVAARAIAGACVAVALGTVAVRYPAVIQKLGDRASRSSSFTFDDRDFAAGNSIIPDKGVLYEARSLIPRTGSYRVVTGAAPISGASYLTRSSAAEFATYFLMPRRPQPDAHWVICLGCDATALSPHVRVVWTDGAGSSLLRTAS